MPSGENGNAAKKAGRKTAGRAGRRPLCDLKKEGPGREKAAVDNFERGCYIETVFLETL